MKVVVAMGAEKDCRGSLDRIERDISCTQREEEVDRKWCVVKQVPALVRLLTQPTKSTSQQPAGGRKYNGVLEAVKVHRYRSGIRVPAPRVTNS